jgi:hypothetical protein|tara:strand:+ start:232 stop:387 length:156 start_codon:yes stop_codon:yes gene_type:complete
MKGCTKSKKGRKEKRCNFTIKFKKNNVRKRKKKHCRKKEHEGKYPVVGDSD